MQGDLYSGFDELKYEVLEVRSEKIWNEQSKCFHEFVTYCHTRPKNWSGPQLGDEPPWNTEQT